MIQKIVQKFPFMESVIVYLTWLLDIKFQYKMIRCCFSENENIDKYNISSAFALYGIPLSVISIFYLLGSLILGFATNLFMPVLVIFLVAWGFSAYFAITLNDQFCKKSENHLKGTQNSLYSPESPHHAIIFAQQTDPFRKMFVSDSVDLIIAKFDEKIPFKVYPIFSNSDFENVYTNPNIKWLWIIGHGWRGGFTYSQNGSEAEIKYSRYLKNPNLIFIAQLHCNNGSGETLLEITGLNPDHDVGHMRFPFQNRCYIAKKAKLFLSDSFSPL